MELSFDGLEPLDEEDGTPTVVGAPAPLPPQRSSAPLDFDNLEPLAPDTSRTDVSVREAVGTNPDQFQKKVDAARKTGVPLAVAEQDDGSLVNTVRTRELVGKLADSPYAQKWFGNPANAKLAHDDIDNLTWTEASARFVYSRAVSTAGFLNRSVDRVTRGLDLYSPVTLAEQGLRRILFGAENAQQFRDEVAAKPGLSTAISDVADLLQSSLGLREEDAVATAKLWEEGANVVKGSEELTGYTEEAKQFVTTWEQVKDAPFSNVLPYVVQQGVASVPEMALTLLGPLGFTALVGTQSERIGSERAGNDGRVVVTTWDVLTALPYAISSVFLERLGARGMLGLDDALKEVSVKGVVTAVGKATVKEATTEFGQGVIENVGGSLGTEKGLDVMQAIDEGFAGAVAGGPFGGSIRAVTATVEAGVKGRALKERAEKFRELNARESALRDRDPETWADFQSGLMEDAGVESVRISAEGVDVLLQEIDALPPEQRSLFDVPANLTDGAATGSGAAISPRSFWALPKDTIDKLADHIAFDVNQDTAQEAAEVAELTEMMSSEGFTAEVAAELASVETNTDLFVEIEQSIMQAGGALTADPAAARAAAQQMAAVFTTMAKRTGVPLQKIKDRFLPRIEGATGQPAVTAPTREAAEIPVEVVERHRAAKAVLEAEVKARVEAKGRLSDLGIDQKDTPAFEALMDEIDGLDVRVNEAREEYDAAQEARWAATPAVRIEGGPALEQGRIRSVWDKLRGKDSSSSVVTLRHGGPALEGGKLDLEFTGRANDPTSTSPRETTGVYFSTEGGTQATQFASTRSGSRVRRLYEARLPAESLSGVVDFMSRVSDLSPEMQQTLADLAAEAGIKIGRGEIAGNLISSIRNELENGTELLVEAGISGHEKKLINEMVIWDQALLDSAELFDVTEGDPVQLRQSAKEFGVSAEVLKAELDAVGGDITQTPRFKEWFKQGKLLDAEGKPLALFHRTEADIEAFVPGGPNLPDNYRGDNFDLSGRAVFLSTDPAAPEANFRIGDQGGENILPVYSSLQNPFYYDPATSEFAQAVYAEGDPAPGEFPRQISDAAIARLKEDGHDGVVVQDADGNISEVLVFDPTQIKSAFNRGAFDPASDNILFQDDIETKRETKQDERVADKNAHGLMPYLRDYSDAEPRRAKKDALGQTTTNKNARKNLAIVDEVLAANPDAHTSVEAWLQMMADAYGAQDVPIAPYRFIEEINGQGAIDNLARLTPGQIEDANHGFENAADFREAYTSGKLGVETTAKLFLWSFLSRGVSPYTQEGLFIDAFSGIDPWIKQAAAGELDVAAFSAWAKTAAPKGSGQPGAGSTHNLNAFGRDFLVKMSQPMEGSNQSKLEYIHDLMSDPESTGQQVRREFAALGQGVGIDNKVVSFTLLVAGYNDVLVLDRVQFRQLYNDGRFDDVNIYDGFKEDGKVVTASGFSKQGDGARGILIYEAMERAVAGRINEIYTELGREGEGSVGRYHWETWVADSQQEASHGSLGAILPAALGDNTAINKVSAKQGEYGSYAYGARYGVDGSGIGYFTYPTPSGTVWLFTIDQFVEFQTEVRKARNGVVPTKFKVTEAGNAPWYTSEEVNVEILDQLAERISSGQAGDGAGTLFQDGADQLISDRLPADPASEQRDLFQEVDFVGDVIFEVAPDPNNVELSARWNALPPAAQLAISDTVSKSVLPSVLEAAGAEGSVSPQIGSYLDDTNPSFSLRLTSGDPAAVANAVGFVLSQDSMVALAGDAFEGSFEAGAVRIQVGDKSLQEIDAIYQTLRGIEGFPQIGGQSTTDGQMTLILEEGVDVEAFSDAVVSALPSEYSDAVLFDAVNVSFPEKKDYDYGSSENDPAGESGLARQRYRAVRDQAAREVAAAIDQYERGGQQPSASGQQLGSGARGSIEGARPTDVQDIVIRLYKAENLSTFLHESGHLYLKMLGTLASDATAPQQVKDDFASVLKFLGVKSEGEIGTAQHEKWAETYEQYLRNGTAPSQELRSAFAKFSAWLTTLYSNIKSIGTGTAALNKEITGVMDRLLATDEQIANVQSEMRMAPMFKDAEAAGMTDEAFAEYKQRYEDARESAHEELVQEAFAETRRERTKWWREELQRETDRVLESMDTDPAWRTRAIIQRGILPSGAPLPEVYPPRMKLNKAATAAYGHDLPGGNQLFARDGVDPERAAQDLGYPSGDQMLYDLSQLPKDENGKFLTATQFADRQAREFMLQEHGDIMNPDEMHEAALMRVHSRRQAQVILDELRLLNRKAGGQDRVTNTAARNAAEQAMSEKTISEIESPTKYLNAERRFSMKAAEAVIAGDIDAALRFKTQQLLNFHMYRTARDMRLKADKMIATLSKRSRQKMDPKKVEPSFITQIKAMVSGLDFSSRMSQNRQALLSSETLQNWADQQSLKYGATFHISPELDRALSKQNIRDFTFSELEGLHDTVKSIYTQGLRYADAQTAQFNSIVQNMGYDIDANAKKKVRSPTGQRTRWEGTKSFVRLAFAEHRHILSLSEELDGYEQNGSVYSNVYQPIKRADDRYIDRSMQAAAAINKILSTYTKGEKLGFLSKKYIPELKGTTNPNLSRNERLAFGLNMGNAGNVAVMKDTYTDAQIDAVMATLTDKDVDVIESIWEQIDSYWPELSALEERTTGVKPAKVEPSPFVLPSGRKVKGGYYPLLADPNADRNSKEQYMSSQTLQAFSSGGKAKVSTKHGSTIERQGFGERPVWLDLRGLFEHIDGVVKDIEMREAVSDVNRVIRSKPFEKAVKDAKGSEFYEMFNNWLENTVGASKPPITTVEKMSQYARTGASIAEMGLSVRTILMQPFGFTNTVALLGEKYAAKGLAEFIGQRGGSVRKVMEASAFMRNRSATFNRDVREANRWMGVDSLKQDVVNASFLGIQYLDMAVSIPSWLGAYQKALDEGRAHDDAVDFADQTVSRGQGTGLPRDMADISQGPVWKKMFTMFYSYFSAYQNMQTDMWKQTNFKNPAQAMKYAKNQIWVTIIPSIAVDALFNQLFGGDDETLWLRVGGSIAKTLLGGMVFVRDVANVVASGFKFDYQLTPAGNPIKEVGNVVKQLGPSIEDGEMSTPLIKSLIMFAGYAAQLPGARQASRAYSVVSDEDTSFEIDEFESWYRLLVTGPKRDN